MRFMLAVSSYDLRAYAEHRWHRGYLHESNGYAQASAHCRVAAHRQVSLSNRNNRLGKHADINPSGEGETHRDKVE